MTNASGSSIGSLWLDAIRGLAVRQADVHPSAEIVGLWTTVEVRTASGPSHVRLPDGLYAIELSSAGDNTLVVADCRNWRFEVAKRWIKRHPDTTVKSLAGLFGMQSSDIGELVADLARTGIAVQPV